MNYNLFGLKMPKYEHLNILKIPFLAMFFDHTHNASKKDFHELVSLMVRYTPPSRLPFPVFIYHKHSGQTEIILVSTMTAINQDSIFSKLLHHMLLKFSMNYNDEIFILKPTK